MHRQISRGRIFLSMGLLYTRVEMEGRKVLVIKNLEMGTNNE
jgi:hypothetical protein